MANKKRRCEPDLTYHTYSRCINKTYLMRTDKMKNLMLNVINMALDKYNFELISYVIMDNHFHFFIRTLENEATISNIMQYIKSQYAQKFNKIKNRCGPFWNERFGDVIVEDSEDPEFRFKYINHYIINNPVRTKYVSNPVDYKYGCIKFYLYEDYVPPVRLTHSKYFLNLGATFKERVTSFKKYNEIHFNNIKLI